MIDTNVVVSATPNPEGLQRTVLLIALSKPARLYVSRPILEEYSGVLSRSELRIRRGVRLRLLPLIENRAHVVVPSRRLLVTRNPDDDIFWNAPMRRGPTIWSQVI